MKKLPLLASVILFTAFGASAETWYTLSAGYAGSQIKTNDGKKHMNGASLSLRYEFNNKWGMVTSFMTSSANYTKFNNASKNRFSEQLTTFTVGPSYRFNDYFSLYADLGMGYLSSKNKTEQLNNSEDVFTYGIGMIANPVYNLSADVTVRKSDFIFSEATTIILGLGYRF